MKDSMKKIITVAVTLAVLCVLIVVFSTVITPKYPSGQRAVTTDMWEGFYQEPKNTVDVFFVGPSTVYNGISPSELYDQQGFTSYDLSSPMQTTLFSEMYILEGLRTQKPSVIVLDQTSFLETNMDSNEPKYRITMDNLKFSWDKVKLSAYIAAHSERQSFLSYIFPLLRYHSLWEDVLENGLTYNLQENEWPYYAKGCGSLPLFAEQTVPMIYEGKTDEIDESYDPEGLKAFYRIVDLCKKENIQLLVTKLPIMSEKHTYAQHNGMEKLCESVGVPFIDFNMEDIWKELELDPKTSFQSDVHLNIVSADNVTRYMGEYLKAHYDLPDHRGDDAYSVWADSVAAGRADVIAHMVDYSMSRKSTSMIGAVMASDDATEIYWPTTSYLHFAKLYRQLPGGEKELLTDSADGSFLDTNVPTDTKYTVVYDVDGISEPCEITFDVLNPIWVTKTKSGTNKITVTKLPGNSDFELFRQAEDGSWVSIAREIFVEKKAFTDKDNTADTTRYKMQYTDKTGTVRTYEFIA